MKSPLSPSSSSSPSEELINNMSSSPPHHSHTSPNTGCSHPPRPRISQIIRSKAFRRFFKLTLRFLTSFLIFCIVLQVLLAYMISKDPRVFPTQLRRAKSLLVVTAHPDDETLFFAPAILGVFGDGGKTRGGLVVMSNGNNYGLGEVRKGELKGACKVLGFEERRCEALDRPALQDNPRAWWDEEAIIAAVKEYVEKWEVDAILTFDHGGISGHINHRAVSSAIKKYASTDPRAPTTYLLSSVTLLRKYTFLFDLPLTAFPFTFRILGSLFFPIRNSERDFGNRGLIANPWSAYLKTREAFRSHDSQYSWDRSLYLVLSRQVWFNDLLRVEKIPS